MRKSNKRLKKYARLRKYVVYSCVVTLAYGTGMYFSPVKSASASEYNQDYLNNNNFSEEALIAFMKELKIKYPETVLAQARLETGNFTSNIFKENHNLFGMKLAEKRPTSAIGINRGHAQYKNWKDSVLDYALLQSFIIARLPADNNKEYRIYIQRFYSETSDYLSRMDETI